MHGKSNYNDPESIIKISARSADHARKRGWQLMDLAIVLAARSSSWHVAVDDARRLKLLLAMSLMEPARESFGFILVVALKSLHTAMCHRSAASMPAPGSWRSRSPTASAQRPHTQLPQCAARTQRM